MQKITAYVATRFENRRQVRRLIKSLKNSKFEVISTWHRRGDRKGCEAAQEGMIDLQEIYQAKALIVLSHKGKVRGGYLYENGYAHALGRKIYLIGPRSVVFHELYRKGSYFKNVKEFVKFAKDGQEAVYKSANKQPMHRNERRTKVR